MTCAGAHGFILTTLLNSVNYFLERKTLDMIADDAEVSRISRAEIYAWRRRYGSSRAATYPADFTGVRSPGPRLRALCGSYQPRAGLSYRPDIRGHEKRSCATTGRSRCMAGAARERADERQSSGKCFFRRPRDGMLTIGRPFRSRVSAFDRPIAAPMADPVSDRKGTCTIARGQTLARRDCARMRLCRSKPLHKGLYAPSWYQPGRLAATTGNCTEAIKKRALGSSAVDTPAPFDSNETKDVSFAQERLGLAR